MLGPWPGSSHRRPRSWSSDAGLRAATTTDRPGHRYPPSQPRFRRGGHAWDSLRARCTDAAQDQGAP
eukprot:15449014-Alexandrium_andersonii.AAC.2